MILTKRQQSLFRGNGSGVGTLSARETADAVISALTPAAWYRNATDVVSSGGFASIWADYASSDKGLVLPGVNGNYASTPDAAPVSVTGDISILVRVRLNDYTPASAQALVYKLQTVGQYSYAFAVNATFPGRLSFFYSPDGTALREAISSANNGVTDGDATWLKVTYNSTTGKVNFSKAADSTSIPSSWTAIGTEQTLTAGAIFDGNTALGVGATGGGLGPSTGIFYRAIIYSDLTETTKVFDADFSSQAIGTASFTESSSNAATVTINTSGASPAHIGKARDLLQGTGTNQPAYAAGIMTGDGADNFLRTAAFTLDQPSTVVAIFRQDSWTLDDSVWDGATALNRRRLYTPGSTPNMTMYAGGVGPANTGATIGTWRVVKAFYNGASSTLNVDNGADSTGNAGTNTASGFTLFADGQATPVSYGAKSVAEVILFSGEISAGDWTSLYNALDAIRDSL